MTFRKQGTNVSVTITADTLPTICNNITFPQDGMITS